MISDEERDRLAGKIAANLVRARTLVGASKAEVARGIGVEWAVVHAWENGRTPNAVYIVMLAEYLGVSADYLLGLTDEQLPTSADEKRDLERDDAATSSDADESSRKAASSAGADAPPPPVERVTSSDRAAAIAEVLAAASQPRASRSSRRRD